MQERWRCFPTSRRGMTCRTQSTWTAPRTRPPLRNTSATATPPVILSEIPVRLTPSQSQGHRIPDLLGRFWRRPGAGHPAKRLLHPRPSAKPPDFVLEVASERTADNDVRGKRVDYAGFRDSGILAVRPHWGPAPRRPVSRRPAGGRNLQAHRDRRSRARPPARPQ